MEGFLSFIGKVAFETGAEFIAAGCQNNVTAPTSLPKVSFESESDSYFLVVLGFLNLGLVFRLEGSLSFIGEVEFVDLYFLVLGLAFNFWDS